MVWAVMLQHQHDINNTRLHECLLEAPNRCVLVMPAITTMAQVLPHRICCSPLASESAPRRQRLDPSASRLMTRSASIETPCEYEC